MRITWPLAAIVVAAIAGVTVILSVSDSQTRSAVIAIMITVTTTLSAIYARQGSTVDAETITRKVLHELGVVKRQVNGHMTELIKKIPDQENTP